MMHHPSEDPLMKQLTEFVQYFEDPIQIEEDTRIIIHSLVMSDLFDNMNGVERASIIGYVHTMKDIALAAIKDKTNHNII